MSGRRFKLLDGGTATELVRLGHSNIDTDPLWSARLLQTDPEIIVQSHKGFLLAGSDVVVTASYQASVDGFVEHLGVSREDALELIARSVVLARRACTETSQEKGKETGSEVAGSVGPYGACLHDGSEYTGHYVDTLTQQDLMEWHRPRLEALVNAGADYIAVETIPSQKEAEAVVALLREFPSSKAWVTFSCKDGSQTCHGELFSGAVKAVSESENVIAVGVNCTEPQYISPLLESIQHLQLRKPIIVKANSGEGWTTAGWHGKVKYIPHKLVPDWLDRGASWIGGCCRIYPEDIGNIRESITAYNSK